MSRLLKRFIAAFALMLALFGIGVGLALAQYFFATWVEERFGPIFAVAALFAVVAFFAAVLYAGLGGPTKPARGRK